jgi:hypothetical protein
MCPHPVPLLIGWEKVPAGRVRVGCSSSQGPHCNQPGLQVQFQEADFKSQGFLDIAPKPTLELVNDLKVFQCLDRRDAFGHLACYGQIREPE